jgi:hypothetical protein
VNGGKARKNETTRKTKTYMVNTTRTDFREIGWGGTGSIDLPQDKDQRGAVVNTVMNLRVV